MFYKDFGSTKTDLVEICVFIMINSFPRGFMDFDGM